MKVREGSKKGSKRIVGVVIVEKLGRVRGEGSRVWGEEGNK